MITRFFLAVLLMGYGCSSPQKPDIGSVIKRGDSLVRQADELEKKYKKNPASVTAADIRHLYSEFKSEWPIFKDTLKQSQKFGDYWQSEYNNNKFFATIGKWLVGIIVTVLILLGLYGLLKLYLKFGSPTGILSRIK